MTLMIDPAASVEITSHEADTIARYLFELAFAQRRSLEAWEPLWERWNQMLLESGMHAWFRPREALATHDEAERVDTLYDLTNYLQDEVAGARKDLEDLLARLAEARAEVPVPADIAAKVLLADELDRAFPSARLLPVPDAPQAVEEPEAAPVSAPAADEPTGVPDTPEEWPSPAWGATYEGDAPVEPIAPTPAVFTCDICGRSFPRRNHLTMHRRAHSDNPAIQAAVVREREEAATHAVAEAIKERERTPAQNERTEETFEERRRRFAKERVAAGRSGF